MHGTEHDRMLATLREECQLARLKYSEASQRFVSISHDIPSDDVGSLPRSSEDQSAARSSSDCSTLSRLNIGHVASFQQRRSAGSIGNCHRSDTESGPQLASVVG
jgi:hypothetical protein